MIGTGGAIPTTTPTRAMAEIGNSVGAIALSNRRQGHRFMELN
jgi:hypothetical protein